MLEEPSPLALPYNLYTCSVQVSAPEHPNKLGGAIHYVQYQLAGATWVNQL